MSEKRAKPEFSVWLTPEDAATYRTLDTKKAKIEEVEVNKFVLSTETHSFDVLSPRSEQGERTIITTPFEMIFFSMRPLPPIVARTL